MSTQSPCFFSTLQSPHSPNISLPYPRDSPCPPSALLQKGPSLTLPNCARTKKPHHAPFAQVKPYDTHLNVIDSTCQVVPPPVVPSVNPHMTLDHTSTLVISDHRDAATIYTPPRVENTTQTRTPSIFIPPATRSRTSTRSRTPSATPSRPHTPSIVIPPATRPRTSSVAISNTRPRTSYAAPEDRPRTSSFIPNGQNGTRQSASSIYIPPINDISGTYIPPEDMSGPQTPLVTPRIGIVKRNRNNEPLLKEGENPWIIPSGRSSADVKITAITPIGTIAMVPTLDQRPPPTQRRIAPPSTPTPGQTPTRHLTLSVVDSDTSKIDPLLSAAIYLDCTRSEDRGYNHVAERMRSITQNTLTLQKQYVNELYHIPPITGRVSPSTFENALSIYENNQVYYQDRIDDGALDVPNIRKRLTELEHWFISIIEPVPDDIRDIESRKSREQFKISNGLSAYCDPELYPYITRAPAELKASISRHHIGL